MDKNSMTHTPGDGNRIIAEFMAVKIEEDTNRMYYLLPNMTTETKTGWYQVDRMQYHTSWDWLMPACKKWNDLVASKLKEPGWMKWQYQRVMLDTDIEKLFNRLIEKIQWYNTPTDFKPTTDDK